MPAPLVAAGIAAGASLLGTGGQIYAAGKMNKKTRAWNEKMYGVQRADALSDWNMMNAYNSPEQQMQRFKEAGLNPNLIYGQQNEGATVRSTEAKGWNPETPDLSGIGRAAQGGIQAYQDITLQQETVKNMQAQRENMALDGVIKALQAKQIEQTTATGAFDLGMKEKLADTAISTAQENLRAISTGTDLGLKRFELDAAMNTANLKMAAENILNARMSRAVSAEQINQIRAQAAQLRSSTILNELDADLKRQGIQPGDELWQRVLGRVLSGNGESLPKILDKGLKSDFMNKDLRPQWLQKAMGDKRQPSLWD